MADVATATVFYRKTAATGVPEVQTLATLKTDLGLTGTNSGDQTSIVGITGSVAQFNTAITDGDLATGGGTATGTNTGDQTITLTGNVTGSGTGSFIATIANAAVTLPKMADVPSASVFYRKTAATGAPEVQTLATLKTDLGLTGTNTGDQTSIVGIIGTVAQFNTAVTDGDFATGNGTANGTNTGDQTITLTGNVTGSGTGSFIATIANAAVTLAKMADVATATVFYRKTAATGVPEVQTLATLKTDLGLTGTNSGDQSIVLSGDVSGSGTTAITTTLATVNSNVGSFGLAASVSQFTVNAKGLITAAANVVISIASTAISDSTAAGRAMLTAATAAAQTALLSVFVPSGASAAKGLVPSPPGVVGVTNFLREDGTWALPPGASGGEANTASNVGVGGVGVFKQKTVFNLEFKNINVASTKLSVTNDAANNEIDLDVIEANLTLGNLGGNLPIAGGGTAATTAAAARSNLGFGTTGAGNVFGAAINLGLSSSVAANALTVALKGADGNDPSATNPVLIPFRNTTATIGTPTWLSVTAAASIVVSSGSTLGTANSNSFTFWVVGFNDAGTFRMGIIQAGNNRLLSGSDLVSSTAEGGAGAADALDTFYTGTAVTAKAYCILGYVEYIPGLATAGTYATAPTETQVFGPGVPVAARLQTLQKFTASGTWTRPAGCRRIFARVVGGGGGAASALGTATTAEVSGGGAAGAYSEGWFDVTATPSIVITVGTGGAGGAAAASNAGVAGIASSLGALMTATGGSLSGVMTDGTTVVANPGAIETAAGTGGDLNVPGSGGDYGMRTSGTTGVGGNGGAGPFGGGPRGAPINTAGSNATAPGSGGSGAASGTATGRAGGNGAAGIIIIEEYY